MDNLSTFAERLKEYMNEHDLSVSALAREVQFSRITLSKLLNKTHTPSTEIITVLAEYFNCSVDYLLGLIDYPHLSEFKEIKPFGETLRKCLKESGKSEYRLQKDLHISRSLTYRWLNNKTLPSIDSLIKLKTYFDCSLDYLLGREL